MKNQLTILNIFKILKIPIQNSKKMSAHNYGLKKRSTELCVNYVKIINIIHSLFTLKVEMFWLDIDNFNI